MKAEWGKSMGNPRRPNIDVTDTVFEGQESPWVQPAAEGGVIITYYEVAGVPVAVMGKAVPQKRVTLRLNAYEREHLKGLL